MLIQVTHSATVTVQLPFEMCAREEVAALRAAGIPVDDLGNATSGYLFVRTTGRVRKINTFRWFATCIGSSATGVAPSAPDVPETQLSFSF